MRLYPDKSSWVALPERYSTEEVSRYLHELSERARIPVTTSVIVSATPEAAIRETSRNAAAEAIRDSMLAAAGRLDLEPFGEPVDGVEDRRSVYVHVSRNNPDPLLAVFGAPIPTSTKGRRLVTNVPAQALSMMNSDYVHDLARAFAKRVKRESIDDGERIARMFELGLGRKPSVKEVAATKVFLAAASQPDFKNRNRRPLEHEIEQWRLKQREFEEEAREEKLDPDEVKEGQEEFASEIEKLRRAAREQDEWYELALAVFCMKEFIYLP